MKIIRGGIVKEIYAYVLLRNGSIDERIVSALAERYNHSKEMRIPTISPRPTGLDAVVKALVRCMDKSIVMRYIIALDHEHITSKMI